MRCAEMEGPVASEPWEELSKLSVVEQAAEGGNFVPTAQQTTDEDVNGYARWLRPV